MKTNIFLFIVVVAVATFVGWQYYDQFGLTLTHDRSNVEVAASWGAFGDYIGGVLNPLIAGVGLIFFIITLKQNEKALKMSADELRLTRQELREASRAQQEIAQLSRQDQKEARDLRQLSSLKRYEKEIIDKLDRAMKVKLPFGYMIDGITSNEFSFGEILRSRNECPLILKEKDLVHIIDLVSILEDSVRAYHQVYRKIQGLEYSLGAYTVHNLSNKLKNLSCALETVQYYGMLGEVLMLSENDSFKDMIERTSALVKKLTY